MVTTIPEVHHTHYVAGLESSEGTITLERNRTGLGYRLTDRAEGFGPADVEVDSTPRVGRRGSMLGHLREVAGDMVLPIVLQSKSKGEVKAMLAELSRVLRHADGPVRLTLTNPVTGETRYREVFYKDGIKTPTWVSPFGEEYRVTVEYLDPWAYSTTTESVTLPVTPGASGGFTLPLEFPISFARSAQSTDRWGTNTGNNPAPVTLRFDGPVTDPEAELQGHWRFKIAGSLEWDEYLLVTPDLTNPTVTIYSTTRPNHSRSAFTMLGASSKITDLVLPPGQHAFSFRAIDPTYTATMTASWPHTHKSMY